MDDIRYPTLDAYLDEDQKPLTDLTEEQLDDIEIHVHNLECAMVNLYRSPLSHKLIYSLLGSITDNAPDVAHDSLFDSDCLVYRNKETT